MIIFHLIHADTGILKKDVSFFVAKEELGVQHKFTTECAGLLKLKIRLLRKSIEETNKTVVLHAVTEL